MAAVSSGSANRTLAEWFHLGFTAGPEQPALIMHQRSWSYRELHDMALQVAAQIEASLDSQPCVVGLLANRSSVASYTGLLGTLYAGAVVVPLEGDGPAARNIAMATAARVDVLLAEPSCGEQATTISQRLDVPLLVLDPRPVARPANSASDRSEPFTGSRTVEMSDVAYIMFTSGTTGVPKAVPISHANISHFLTSMSSRYELRPGDVVSQTFDLTFDLAMFDLFVAWSVGATVAHVAASMYASLCDAVNRLGITVWFSVPSTVDLVSRTGQLREDSMPGLRLSLFCGEPLRVSQAESWQRAAPASIIENLYGPTEATVACTGYRWDPVRSPARCVNAIVPIGQPLPGIRVAVVDERLSAVAEGELLVAGPQVFDGYLNSTNQDALLDLDGIRWYRSGDRVRLIEEPEHIAFVGRLDDQVQIRGRRVEAAEIECAMCNLDGVDRAVALIHQEAEGHAGLVAFYVGSRPKPDGMVTALANTLPDYMLPRRVWRLERLPLNRNGKTDRSALRSLASERLKS